MSHNISINIEESAIIQAHFYNTTNSRTCIELSLQHDDGRAPDDLAIWARPERLQEILDALQGALNGARAELAERRALNEARAEVAEATEVPA